MDDCRKCFDNFLRGLGTRDCIMPDGICMFKPILRALPSASPEQIRQATAMLEGKYNCANCKWAEPADDKQEGEPKLPFMCGPPAYSYCAADWSCPAWTERTDPTDKE